MQRRRPIKKITTSEFLERTSRASKRETKVSVSGENETKLVIKPGNARRGLTTQLTTCTSIVQSRGK
jgi:hypothetical protein